MPLFSLFTSENDTVRTLKPRRKMFCLETVLSPTWEMETLSNSLLEILIYKRANCKISMISHLRLKGIWFLWHWINYYFVILILKSWKILALAHSYTLKINSLKKNKCDQPLEYKMNKLLCRFELISCTEIQFAIQQNSNAYMQHCILSCCLERFTSNTWVTAHRLSQSMF